MALSASTRASASDCWRPFSTMPASRSATAPSWATSAPAEHARLLGLDVEHADDLVVPGQRHAEHRGDEPALVDAADPQEARVGLDVGDDQRAVAGGDVAGDALAERHPRPADLEAVEAVGRGQRQVRSIAVEQVERGDIGMERVARPVDDRLQQLVPRPRRRRQAGDVVQEAQLVRPLRWPDLGGSRERVGWGRSARDAGLRLRRDGRHRTRVGKVAVAKGCGAVPARLRSCAADPPVSTPRPARSPERAEPAGIGSAGARDPLAREVRLLGALLGQVIIEQAGAETYEPVERIRRRAIALRRADDPLERERQTADLDALDLGRDRGGRLGLLAVLPAGQPGRGPGSGAGAASSRARRPRRAARRLRRRGDRPPARAPGATTPSSTRSLAGLRISPVLTAHPTEARRRTTLIALRRCAVLLERLDDPRLTPSEDREIRRRLREEITLLWRTSDLRTIAPEPLDEVRTAMAVFDATLFTVVPRLYRATDAALDAAARPGRPDRRAAAARAGLPALRQLDRRRPRRQPVRHGRDDRADPAHPGRPRPARLRGRRPAPHADRVGGGRQ